MTIDLQKKYEREIQKVNAMTLRYEGVIENHQNALKEVERQKTANKLLLLEKQIWNESKIVQQTMIQQLVGNHNKRENELGEEINRLRVTIDKLEKRLEARDTIGV